MSKSSVKKKNTEFLDRFPQDKFATFKLIIFYWLLPFIFAFGLISILSFVLEHNLGRTWRDLAPIFFIFSNLIAIGLLFSLAIRSYSRRIFGIKQTSILIERKAFYIGFISTFLSLFFGFLSLIFCNWFLDIRGFDFRYLFQIPFLAVNFTLASQSIFACLLIAAFDRTFRLRSFFIPSVSLALFMMLLTISSFAWGTHPHESFLIPLLIAILAWLFIPHLNIIKALKMARVSSKSDLIPQKTLSESFYKSLNLMKLSNFKELYKSLSDAPEESFLRSLTKTVVWSILLFTALPLPLYIMSVLNELGFVNVSMPYFSLRMYPLIALAVLPVGFLYAMLVKHYLAAFTFLIALPGVLIPHGVELTISETLHFLQASGSLFASLHLARVVNPVKLRYSLISIFAPFVLIYIENMPQINLAIFFGVYLAINHIIAHFIKQNFLDDNSLKLSKLHTALPRTIGFWSLLAVCIVTAHWISSTAVWNVKELIYESGILVQTGAEADIEKDFETKVQKIFTKKRIHIDTAINNAGSNIQQQTQKFPEAAMLAFDKVYLPTEQISEFQKECKGGHVWCCIEDRIRTYLRTTYQNVRIQIRANYENYAVDSAQGVSSFTEYSQNYIRPKLVESLKIAEANTLDVIDGAFIGFRMAQIALTIIFLLAVIKSVLVIFSRVSYEEGLIEKASFSTPLPTRFSAKLKSEGQNFKLLLKTRAYVLRFSHQSNKNVSIVGFPENVTIPMPFSCPIVRIISGIFLMDSVEPKQEIVFSGLEGTEFATWQLQEGEKVITRVQDVLAFEESVKFEKIFNLRLSTLVFGKIFATQLVGPGVVVFRTSGKCLTNGTKESKLTRDIEHFVAWDCSTAFKVIQTKSIKSMYLDGVRVKLLSPGAALIDSGGKDKRGWASKMSVGRFIKTFLIPV